MSRIFPGVVADLDMESDRHTLFPDTHPAIEHAWMEIIRKASIEKRFHLLRSLTATAISLARSAIAEANPGATEDELAVAFVRIHHGDRLAGHLERFLDRRRRKEDE